MNKNFFKVWSVLGFLFLAAPASAQQFFDPAIFQTLPDETTIKADQPTPPGYVAMIFYKLAAQVPELEKWALESEDYKAANSFDKQVVFEQKVSELKDIFRMAALSEPIMAERTEKISEYSFRNKGFTVESFAVDTYFPYTFAGRNYALVIQNLMDQQWLDIADEKMAMVVDTAAVKAEHKVKMRFYIEPKYADSKAPIKLDGKEYWLISGVLKNIAIYDGDKMLWKKNTKSALDELTPVNQEMLELYNR